MLAEGDQSVRQAGGWAQASKRCLAGGAGAVVMIDAIAVAKSYGAEAVIDRSTCTPTTDRGEREERRTRSRQLYNRPWMAGFKPFKPQAGAPGPTLLSLGVP